MTRSEFEVECLVERTTGPAVDFYLPINREAHSAGCRDGETMYTGREERRTSPPNRETVRPEAASRRRASLSPIEIEAALTIAIVPHHNGLTGEIVTVEIFAPPMRGIDCVDAWERFPAEACHGRFSLRITKFKDDLM